MQPVVIAVTKSISKNARSKNKMKKEKTKTIKSKKLEKPTIKVSLPPINRKSFTVTIIGKTPLLMDKFPDEVKKQILDKQRGKSQVNKKIRDIDHEIYNAIHYDVKGNVSFPIGGIKAGMIESTSFVGT